MSSTGSYKVECEALVSALQKQGGFPQYVQTARCEGISIVNVSDSPLQAGLVDLNTFVGFASDPYLAFSIALTEYIERRVCRNNRELRYANEGVGGRSIFPGYSRLDAHAAAAYSALYEAIERHVWASWWDDDNVKFSYERCSSQFGLGQSFGALVRSIQEMFPEGHFAIVRPEFEDRWNASVLIVLYFLNGQSGVISGGACGLSSEEEHILFRATSEMLRHGQALHRYRRDRTLRSTNLYNDRLIFFGTSEGADLAQSGLQKVGRHSLQMPPLACDRELRHEFESVIVLHQCRFENQPEFIGGPVERLCL